MAAALAVMMMLALSALSRGRWRPHLSSDAVLRIALSARPERIETCRTLSQEELAARPAHMRLAVECTGGFATYRLRAWRDSVLVDDRVLHGGGFRRDRPIHVLREYPVPAGVRSLRIVLGRIEQAPGDSAEPPVAVEGAALDRRTREAAERSRRRLEALPPAVEWTGRVTMRPRHVALVTWDPVTRRLTAGH